MRFSTRTIGFLLVAATTADAASFAATNPSTGVAVDEKLPDCHVSAPGVPFIASHDRPPGTTCEEAAQWNNVLPRRRPMLGKYSDISSDIKLPPKTAAKEVPPKEEEDLRPFKFPDGVLHDNVLGAQQRPWPQPAPTDLPREFWESKPLPSPGRVATPGPKAMAIEEEDYRPLKMPEGRFPDNFVDNLGIPRRPVSMGIPPEFWTSKPMASPGKVASLAPKAVAAEEDDNRPLKPPIGVLHDNVLGAQQSPWPEPMLKGLQENFGRASR